MTTGAASVADAEATAATVVTVQRLTAAGTKGVSYEVVVVPGTGFSVTSLDATNSTQSSDTSTVGYIEVDPGPGKQAQGPPSPTASPSPP